MNETWQIIPNFPDYEASDNGRIRRYTNGTNTSAGHILRPNMSPKGYLNLKLYRERQRFYFSVHRLIAFTFLSDTYFENAQINHKDGNKANNCVENLEWCTAKENKQHSIKVLGHDHNGENSPNTLLTNEQVLEIHKLLMEGCSSTMIRQSFQISKSVVSRIRRRIAWGTVLSNADNQYPATKIPRRKGEAHGRHILQETDIPLIRQEIEKGISCQKIATKFNVGRTTIQHIKNGDTWTHV